MGWVETRITRTSQPQDAVGVDWSNPLTKGLISWLDASGPAGALVKTPSTLGVALQSQASTGSGLVLPSATRNTGSGTILILADFKSNSSYGEYFWDGIGSSNRDLFYQLGSDAGADFDKFGWYLNSVLISDNGQLPINAGFLSNGAAFLSWTTGVQKAYVGGVVSQQWARTVAAGSVRGVRVGSRFGGTDNLTSSKLVQRAEWNRALSDAEIKSLSDNPWQIFAPDSRSLWVPETVSAGGGATTGTLAATETGSDTAVLSGQVIVQGILAATEAGQDTAALAGQVIITGTLSAAEIGSDTAAINGSASVTTTGTLAATESGSDTAALTGLVLVQAALSATESGADAAAIAGQVLVQGTLAAAEQGSDTALINGSSVITTTGTLNATEQGSDTAAMTGQVLVQALIDAAEQGADTAQLAGQIVVTGVLAAAEVGGDTAAFYNTAPVVYIAGAQTRPSRIQSSSRPSRIQSSSRASR